MLIGAIAKMFGDVTLTEICQLAFIWSVITSKFLSLLALCFVLFCCTLMIRALFVTGPLWMPCDW